MAEVPVERLARGLDLPRVEMMGLSCVGTALLLQAELSGEDLGGGGDPLEGEAAESVEQ